MASTNNNQTGIKTGTQTGNETKAVSPTSTRSQSSSLGASIAKGLGIEDQGVIDRAISLAKDYLESTQTYFKNKPGEAIAVTAVAGAALWTALNTEAGRKMIESGKSVAFPQLSKWLHENLRTKSIH